MRERGRRGQRRQNIIDAQEQHYTLRGAGLDWFRRLATRTFGGGNIFSSPETPAPVILENSVQPVLLVNEEQDTPFPPGRIAADVYNPSDGQGGKVPLDVEVRGQGANQPVINPEDSQGMKIPLVTTSQPIVAAGNRRFVGLHIEGSNNFGRFVNVQRKSVRQIATLPGEISGSLYKDFGILASCSMLMYADAAFTRPLVGLSDEWFGKAVPEISLLANYRVTGGTGSYAVSRVLTGYTPCRRIQTTTPGLAQETNAVGTILPLLEIDGHIPEFQVQLAAQTTSSSQTVTLPTLYYQGDVVIEIWTATGGNSAEYPFDQGNELLEYRLQPS